MMSSSVFTTAVICLLFIVTVTSTDHKDPPPPQQDTCGQTFKEPRGDIKHTKKSDTFLEKQSCNWTVTAPENKTVFLLFDLYLLAEDKLHVQADGKEILNLELKNGLVPFLTDKQNITIFVATGDDKVTPTRRLKIFYSTNLECNHTFNQATGIFHSPLYNIEHSSWPIDCIYSFLPQGKQENAISLWLQDFSFIMGTLKVSGAGSHDGTYNAGNFSGHEFLASDQLDLQVMITNKSDSFVAYFDQVSEPCSETRLVTPSSADQPLHPPDAIRQQYIAASEQSLTCQWLVDVGPNKTITIDISDVTLPGKTDQILILDGPNRFSPVLHDVNAVNNPNEPKIYSTGNSIWVQASTPFFNSTFNFNIKVTETSSGGHLRNQGAFNVMNVDTTYLLEVDSGKQVQLAVDMSKALKDQGVVMFYQDFTLTGQPFETFTAGRKLASVVSPTEKMAVVTKNFGSSAFTGNFSGIDQGCYKYGQASGDTFSVSGHSNATCAWIVKPVNASKDLLTFHFHNLNLGANDHMFIQKLDDKQTRVANLSSATSLFPDLWLPAESGAFVQLTRGDCQANSIAVQASYQVIPGCQTIMTPKLGETVNITSPGYPNHYPLGTDCSWMVLKPNTSAFLLVSFKDIQLAQKDHSIKVFSVGATETLVMEFNGTNQTLPSDLPIFGNVNVNFTTSTQMPMQSMPGFKVEVTVVEFGAFMSNSTGKIETPEFPKPVDKNSLFTWMIKVDSPEKAKQILKYSFSNQTNNTGLSETLKIYDGNSLRSGLLTNYSSEEILSRTNQLVVVYQKTGNTSGPAFSLSYNNFTCNTSLMCMNGICMHEDWFCDGINNCGDFSDERNCEGGGPSPPPPPPPPPTPTPSEGAKGVSTAALAVGILVALVIGVVLGIGAPSAYRKLRGSSRFQSYSSFTNNIE